MGGMIGHADAACPAAPQNWAAASCSVGGSNVCSISGTELLCDVSGAAGASEVVVVSDYSTAYQYEAWGDKNGTLFCCEYSSTIAVTIQSVRIEGSGYADQLGFTWSSLAYNLKPFGSVLTATINGEDGNDTLNGSEQIASYSETLNGEDGEDTVKGNADADILSGGNGADTLMGGVGDDVMDGDDGNDIFFGGGGDDVMDGGNGNDEMEGGTGNDTMNGDDGDDILKGGDGDDIMDGGDDDDVLCGEGETGGDDLFSGLGTDYLWGAGPLDDVNCNGLATAVYVDISSNTIGPCIVNLTTPPAACQ